MGLMLDGVYYAEDPAPDTADDGRFRREAATIRHQVSADGPFGPEPGRYHLYAAWNCPWAHRALLGRLFAGLSDAMTVSYARPRRTDQGWVYDTDGPYADPCLGVAALHEVYARQAPGYTGRVTVPVLWDRRTERIVSNESADILRMFLTVFDASARFSPPGLRDDIDRWNDRIYRTVNNGVYRAGFARTQEAYDEAVTEVFATLDAIERHLESHATLAGDTLTEADLRLFPTLARFDVAYHYAFKCNLAKISDYPQLWDYARAIHAVPGVSETVKFDIYKQGYFSPSPARNPLGIVPKGPRVDWSQPSVRRFER